VVQAPASERLIKGGLPTEAMVASVLVAKYAWHLPLCVPKIRFCNIGDEVRQGQAVM
jgi:hypothetical protein